MSAPSAICLWSIVIPSNGLPSMVTLLTYRRPSPAPVAVILSGRVAPGRWRVNESKKGAPMTYTADAGSTRTRSALADASDQMSDLGRSPWLRRGTMRSSDRNPHSARDRPFPSASLARIMCTELTPEETVRCMVILILPNPADPILRLFWSPGKHIQVRLDERQIHSTTR